MGMVASWLATRGRSRASILQEICLAPTDRFEQLPKSPVVGGDFGDGWYVVLFDFFAGELDTLAMQLSIGCDVIMARMDENVLCSTASQWKDRCEIWSLMRDSRQRGDDLLIRGSPPPEFAAIRDRLTDQHVKSGASGSNEDYLFDIPPALVEALTGFRPDELPADGARFEVLQRQVQVLPGWGDPSTILAALKRQKF